MTITIESSLQFVALKVNQGDEYLLAALAWMKQHGSSLTLDWGEDNDAWECSWISGGVRFTGCQTLLRFAVLESLNKAFARAVEEHRGAAQ